MKKFPAFTSLLFLIISLGYNAALAQPTSCYETFDGTYSYIGIGSMGARPTEGSIAFYVKAPALASYPNVLSTGGNYDGDASGNRCIRFELYADGRLTFLSGTDGAVGLSDITYATITNSFSVDTWHQIVVTWNSNANTMVGYYDGALAFNITCTTWPTNFNNVRIGDGYDQVRKWNGNIDDVSFWSKQLSPSEINGLIAGNINTSDPALTAYYDFEGITANGDGETVLNKSAATAGSYNGITMGNTCFPENSCAVINCNMMLWLKADEGVYSDAGITPAINGEGVARWNDQSGSGNHMHQDNAAQQPEFLTNATNGVAALGFNGAQVMSTLEAINWQNTTQHDIFIVCKNVSPDAMLMESSQDANVNNGSFYVVDNYTAAANGVSAALKDNSGNLRIFKNTDGFIPCTKIYQVTFDMSQAGTDAIKIKLNNSLLTDNTGYNVGSPSNGIANHNLYIGSTGVNTYGMTGNISEIIAYSRKLNTVEAAAVYSYLDQKYFSGGGVMQFSSLPATSATGGNAILDDATWKHSYNTSAPGEIIASVKDNCMDLGARTDSVYVDATATLQEGAYMTMRRHYTISPTLNPPGAKRVRLYYSDTDFADLQSRYDGLTDAAQLSVIQYDGADEDGIFSSTEGSLIFIAPAQITTGTAFGQHYLEFEVSSFSEFWIYADNVPLPLGLLSFTATKKQDTVSIEWQTIREENVQGFEVERSTDARHFETIMTIAAAKNGGAQQYRQWDHKAAHLNVPAVYYRLKQIDQDDKFVYSAIATVNFSQQHQVRIIPNPAKGSITLAGAENYDAIGVFDMAGKSLGLLHGNAKHIYDISHLQPGVYFLKFVNAQGQTVQKLVVR